MCFFRNKLNLGKKLNVNCARISKIPPLHKIEFSLFSRNLKFKIKTRRRNSLITQRQKIIEDKSKVSPEIWKHPKSEKKSFRISYTPKDCKDVSEFRIPPKSAKMFPNFGYPQTVQRCLSNFGYPQTVQRCFRISDTGKSCKDVPEFRILPHRAKMFPNFGYPQTVQRCFFRDLQNSSYPTKAECNTKIMNERRFPS